MMQKNKNKNVLHQSEIYNAVAKMRIIRKNPITVVPIGTVRSCIVAILYYTARQSC